MTSRSYKSILSAMIRGGLIQAGVGSLLSSVLALASLNVHAQPPSGIPEPGLTLVGTLSDSNGLPYLPTNALVWKVSSNQTIVSVSATMVFVNGSVWHLARVPFETRHVAGSSSLPASPNALELTLNVATYTRSAWIGTNQCVLANLGLATFTFSAASRGREDRINLQMPFSTTQLDSDGDGVPDWAELIAGTDPYDASSVFKLSSAIHASPLGGIVIEWSSVPGKSYAVLSSTNLSLPFAPLETNVTAGTGMTAYRDATALGPGPFFYRIRVNQ